MPAGEMIRRLLVDYGEVISTPLPQETITALAALAEQPGETFLDRYWHYRAAYDLGQRPAGYWSQVLDRDLNGAPRIVDRLTDIDVHGWLRLNPLTLRTLLGYAQTHRGTAGAALQRTRTAGPGHRPLPLVTALRPPLLQLPSRRRQARPTGVPARAERPRRATGGGAVHR